LTMGKTGLIISMKWLVLLVSDMCSLPTKSSITKH
jgi:hypothetical protein